MYLRPLSIASKSLDGKDIPEIDHTAEVAQAMASRSLAAAIVSRNETSPSVSTGQLG